MYLSPFEKHLSLLKTLGSREIRRLPLPVLWKIMRLLETEKLTRLDDKVVINSFLPPFPSPAFDRLAHGVNALLQHKAIPVSAYVSITDACRYSCWHCSKAHRSGTPMDRKTIDRSITDLQDMGVSIIGFTGGEPLLNKELEDIVESVDERSATVIFTTGDTLTDSRAKELKKRGLFGAAVSLDHYTPELHDGKRGKKGAFDTALEAISIFRNNGYYTMIQLVATREMSNPDTFSHYLELASRLGVHEIRLLEPMPTGNLMKASCPCTLDSAQRNELRKLHIMTNSSRDLPKVCAFAHIEHRELYGCGAGFQHLYIDAQGNVCPCDFTPISFGNVQRERLPVIWDRMQKAFVQPGATCFLMRNADALKDAFSGKLPLEYEAVKDICTFHNSNDQLPEYYKALGWTESLAAG